MNDTAEVLSLHILQRFFDGDDYIGGGPWRLCTFEGVITSPSLDAGNDASLQAFGARVGLPTKDLPREYLIPMLLAYSGPRFIFPRPLKTGDITTRVNQLRESLAKKIQIIIDDNRIPDSELEGLPLDSLHSGRLTLIEYAKFAATLEP